MGKCREIKLTEDPLTNIRIMVPMLDERAREAVSYFIYGCCIGESIAKSSRQRDGQFQEA